MSEGKLKGRWNWHRARAFVDPDTGDRSYRVAATIRLAFWGNGATAREARAEVEAYLQKFEAKNARMFGLPEG